MTQNTFSHEHLNSTTLFFLQQAHFIVGGQGAIHDAVRGAVLQARCRKAVSRYTQPVSQNDLTAAGSAQRARFIGVVFLEPKSLSVFYTMKVVRYWTSVDDDVDYPPDTFAREVAIYLADPDGWAQFYEFVEDRNGKHIRLSSPHTLKHEGCKDDALSCAVMNGNQIWLNARRWMYGSKASRLPLERYRQYMVTHEMGHSLGYEHVKCPGSGPAPLMMQQTLGIGKCTPNTKLTQTDLQAKQRK